MKNKSKKGTARPSLKIEKSMLQRLSSLKYLLICAILCLGIVLLRSLELNASKVAMAQTPELIETRDEFLSALQNAADGEILLVGDIDFGLPDLPLAVIIDKSVTVKNGKSDGDNAKFKNSSFKVDSLSEKISVCFDGVDFVGPNEDSALFLKSNSAYFSDGQYVPPQIKKNIFSAITLRGDIDAVISDCAFSGYASSMGGAIFTDNSTVGMEAKRLFLKVENTLLKNNAAVFGGGVYAVGKDKNLSFTADNLKIMDCYAENGGAIYSKGASLRLYLSDLSQNAYGGSQVSGGNGGAVCLDEGCDFSARSSKFNKNTASFGGAIYLNKSTGYFDGCVMALNDAANAGGGLYASTNEGNPVTLFNSSIYQNVAADGGGVAFIPNIGNNGKLKLALCTYYSNLSTNEWYSFDLAYQYLADEENRIVEFQAYCELFGNIIIEEKLPFDSGETDDNEEYCYPWAEILPSETNGFNYIATLSQSQDRGMIPNNADGLDHLSISGADAFSAVDSADIPKLPAWAFADAYGKISVGDNADKGLTVSVKTDGESYDYTAPYGAGLTIPTPTKLGHYFDGYVDEAGRAVDLNDIDFSFIFGSISLVPKFSPNQYTLTLTSESGEEKLAVTYGSVVYLQELEKRGSDFLGWYTDENGEGESFKSGAIYLLNGDLTLYAVFKKRFPFAYVFASIALTGAALLLILSAMRKRAVLKAESSAPLNEDQAVAVADEAQVKRREDNSLRSSSLVEALTERERQVFGLLLEGKKRYEIAAVLYVSEETVKKQITSIYKKLGVSSRSELFANFK